MLEDLLIESVPIVPATLIINKACDLQTQHDVKHLMWCTGSRLRKFGARLSNRWIHFWELNIPIVNVGIGLANAFTSLPCLSFYLCQKAQYIAWPLSYNPCTMKHVCSIWIDSSQLLRNAISIAIIVKLNDPWLLMVHNLGNQNCAGKQPSVLSLQMRQLHLWMTKL